MPTYKQAGDLLAERYRLDDLLTESRGGRFWRAHDVVLHRPVAVHIIPADDARAEDLLATARRVAPLSDRRVLRVLDAERDDDLCYVVNEWGQGDSLDNLVSREGPLPPRRAAWIVAEVAESMAAAHALGIAHGRLVPENVMIDHHGHVKIVGLGVDAALRGLPAGRRSIDVTDTVALLYFLLTGTWPGTSRSLVRSAPLSGGLPLRPRQVRAGIPRPLDALCDEVLNPTDHVRSTRSEHDLSTAAGIEAVLRDYLGDYLGDHLPDHPVDHPVGGPASPPLWRAPEAETVVQPAVAGEAQQAAETVVQPPVQQPVQQQVEPQGEPETQATQAGMPVFHEGSDEVEWVRARSTPPVPPPDLAAPEPKPLFAPDPPEGQPVRRPRPGTAAAALGSEAASSSRDYWPWQSDSDSGASGSWSSSSWDSAWTDTGSSATDTGERVPGRSWIRLAMLIGIAAVVLVVAVAAYQQRWGGLGPAPDAPGDDASSQASPTQAPQPFEIAGATDFDPQGSEPREENPDLVPLAIDGDDATSWRTATYRQNFGPGGLKDGVGLVLDLGAIRGVRQVAVAVEGVTTLSAYVTTTAPEGVAGLSPVGSTSGNGVVTITLDEAVSGRFVTVWVTSLPRTDDGFRATISEIQVRG